MKLLFIFISPDKKFSPEYEDLIRIQIDNSLSLGWKSTDIVFAANFDYEYKGVKSIIVGDYTVFDQNRSTKVPVIIELFDKGLIEDDLYWFHDFDAFQLVPFQVTLDVDAGFTDHGAYSKTWNAGSFFFKKEARDIFETIYKYMNLHDSNEQNALTYMWQNNIDGINDRYKLMSTTYNIGIYKIDENIKNTELPIKVAHFHPHKRRHLDLFRSRNMLPEGLLTIFNKYGLT